MRIKREDLYEFIKDAVDGAYSIGMHGITASRAQQFYNIPENMTNEEISDITAKLIIKNGLQIFSARTINGTVAFFGRTDDPDDLEQLYDKLSNYRYGNDHDYIVVATPIELTSPSGETIFIGKTNLDSEYSEYFSTTGSEITCVADIIIPESTMEEKIISPRFILGRFKKISEAEIEFELNPEHVSSKPLTEEEFESIKDRYKHSVYSYDSMLIDEYLLEKDMAGIEEELPKLKKNERFNAPLLETIKQMKKPIRKFDEFDQEDLEALKDTQRTIIRHNIEYLEEQKRYYESLKNLTNEEVCEFIREKPYHLSDLPKEYLDDVELMRKATKSQGLKPIILCYMSDNVRNDSETMINIVNNCQDRSFDYYSPEQDPEKSNLSYPTIGLDVRCNELFWETLNTRMYEIYKDSPNKINYFNIEKEIRIATEEKEKQSKTQK